MSTRTNRSTCRAWTVIAAVAAITVAAAAQERDRAKIPDQYKWNLADIYPTEAAWRAAKDKLAAELPQLRQFQGQLASSAATLADALDRLYALDKELSRLYVYASMLADQDTRDATHQGMQQEMVQLAAAFSRRGGVHRAGDPARRQGDAGSLPRRRTAAQDLSLLPRGRRPARRAHAERQRGEDSRRRRPARGRRRRTSLASSRTPISRIRR